MGAIDAGDALIIGGNQRGYAGRPVDGKGMLVAFNTKYLGVAD
jgi:hypothetical protein